MISFHHGPIDAWKFTGNNIVGIIPNKRSQLACYYLVWGICLVCGPATVGQVTKTKGFIGCGLVHRIYFYIFYFKYDMQVSI